MNRIVSSPQRPEKERRATLTRLGFGHDKVGGLVVRFFPNLIKCILFLLIGLFLFIGANNIVKPTWSDGGANDGTLGFYEQPPNTFETVFLGPSATVYGVIPIELYRDYGMCAYDLASVQQYMIASYYWLQAAFDLHGDSLRNVVLDAKTFFAPRANGMFHIAMDGMHLSNTKMRAAYDYGGSWSAAVEYLLPLWRYHDRWNSLTKIDFTYEPATYLRGYAFRDDTCLDVYPYDQLLLPLYYDETAKKAELDEEILFYFDKIVAFCSENGLNLILYQNPGGGSSAGHNAVSDIAASYGLDFIDFNVEPYASEIDYNRALDTFDSGHPNYYLATRVTSWLGEYLLDHYDVTDVRGNEKYAFMDEELQLFNETIFVGLYMDEFTDVVQYIDYAAEQGYTVLISAKDEASNSLTEAQQASLADVGLKKLSELSYRDSYLAIIEDKKVAYETSKKTSEGTLEENGDTGKSISYTYTLKDGAKVTLISGGLADGNVSSCLIAGTEYSPKSRGLNIVVYDADTSRVIDAAAFDTYASTEREFPNLRRAYEKAIEQNISFAQMSDTMKNLHLYNRRVENTKLSQGLDKQMEEDDLLLFLDTYWDRPDTAIFISALDEAAGALDGGIRDIFAQRYELSALSELEWGDSYLTVIYGGKVLFEQRDHGESPLELNAIWYSVVSGGMDSGPVSSIEIEDTEYSMRQRGLNIVIYDRLLDKVIYQASFDTYGIPQKY